MVDNFIAKVLSFLFPYKNKSIPGWVASSITRCHTSKWRLDMDDRERIKDISKKK
jgi:hypothetical protein